MTRRFCLACWVLLGAQWVATEARSGQIAGTEHEFTSPHGVTERCVEIQPLEGAVYHHKDQTTQANYCKIDFSTVALCPKLWSTSPGTVVYDIGDTEPSEFEQEQCPRGHHARDAAVDKLATFKVSANGRETSATFAPASWVYFHLSRYLHTFSYVPPSVYREIDRQVHLDRVSRSGAELAGAHHSLHMLAAGWNQLVAIQTGELTGAVARESLTSSGEQVFGVMLDNKGDRYGPEFNGTRESGWGNGQNYDFQQTAPFLALRDPQPVSEAARESIITARQNPKMADHLPAETPPAQVVFWMRELLEVVLLDYVLGQQDRIGNIDYRWRWYWLEDGKLQDESAHGAKPPEKWAAYQPVRLRRTAINDNDAGVRRGYANFTQRTGMLKGLRHFDPRLYSRFHALANDLASQGAVYQWLGQSAGLSQSEIDSIAKRASEALTQLKGDCLSGELQLDLWPEQALDPDWTPPPVTGCEPNP